MWNVFVIPELIESYYINPLITFHRADCFKFYINFRRNFLGNLSTCPIHLILEEFIISYVGQWVERIYLRCLVLFTAPDLAFNRM